MRRGIPRVVRRPVVAVLPGAAKRELDHVGLAHDHTELATQRRHKRPVLLPGIRRQAPSRSAKQGYPSAANRSLIETGRPCSGPVETPAANAASAASATARACSGAQNE